MWMFTMYLCGAVRTMVNIGLVTCLVVVLTVDAQRYRRCPEGCCPEEMCAFHRICYPKMHCKYGCPDGDCQKGICLPQKPCRVNAECPIAHACTMNFNLGYNTCQYNLDIGKTLCEDRNGNSLLKPMS